MDLHTSLLTIVAFAAVISVLSVIFNWLLSPVKENQARMETSLKETQDRMDTGLKEMETELKEVETSLRETQIRMEAGFKDLKYEIIALRKDFNGRGHINKG